MSQAPYANWNRILGWQYGLYSEFLEFYFIEIIPVVTALEADLLLFWIYFFSKAFTNPKWEKLVQFWCRSFVNDNWIVFEFPTNSFLFHFRIYVLALQKKLSFTGIRSFYFYCISTDWKKVISTDHQGL